MISTIEPPANALLGDDSALRTYCMWQFPVISSTDKPAVKWKCKGCGSESYGSKKRARYHVLKRPGEGWKICPYGWTKDVLELIDGEDHQSKKRTANAEENRNNIAEAGDESNYRSADKAAKAASKKRLKLMRYEPSTSNEAIIEDVIINDDRIFEDVRDASISVVDKKNKLEERSMYYLNKRAAAYNSGMTDSSQLIKFLDDKIIRIQYEIDKIITEENGTEAIEALR